MYNIFHKNITSNKKKRGIFMKEKEEKKSIKLAQAVQELYCPDCGAKLIPAEGCLYCPFCGWSKCR
ncbi:hypothetical protein TTE2024 [Caldanaerobacter subterraneus subsp. tengcongensis MB4]|uniref:Uncharacterized protein n=1 Tax=Caldanaerobacter subterraneus subsp. tengcongensis (strain DSM 15242 / JCM 11007 / NBRC 100824 / MB4) TaxID=273068 RepID=Q8R8H5_CALS4|nr:hypothetical protein TTE2024 [Caldanaerobacter subterraneus subsp. tengcongensis MB4]